MARHKKDGRRATGIQAKRGYLYIVISRQTIKDGNKHSEKKWIATGLKDTPENVRIAVEERQRFLNSIRKRSNEIDLNISLKQYIDAYLDKKKREIEESTYAAYCQRANRIKKYSGNIKIRDIDEVTIQYILDHMFLEGHYSGRTVKDARSLLSSILEEAYADGLLAFNPAKRIKINQRLATRYTKMKKEDDEFLSFDEAILFLDSIKDHELYELFYLTLFFGLRREEVLGLTWSSIDLKKKNMRINHIVTKGTSVIFKNTAKTEASNREYPLTDEQINMFIQLKTRETENRRLFGDEYKDSDFVFKHVDGSLYYPDYPSKAFRKLIQKIPELPQDITFHGLRKSCVSILVHEGKDVKSIQKWVGHADIDTTLRIYAKVKDKEAKNEILQTMTGIIPIKNYIE